MTEQLQKQSWFHRKQSRWEAVAQLQLGSDFLVRERGHTWPVPAHRPAGWAALVDPEGVVWTKDRCFESVAHLISYHMATTCPSALQAVNWGSNNRRVGMCDPSQPSLEGAPDPLPPVSLTHRTSVWWFWPWVRAGSSVDTGFCAQLRETILVRSL